MSSKALKRFFGATPLDRISPETVEKFKTWRARKKSDFTGRRLRAATINRELACLKILFNRFEDTVPKNPVRKVKFLAEDNEQMRVLTADEEKLYLLAASQPLRDIATMMLETGNAAGRGLPHSRPECASRPRLSLQSVWKDKSGQTQSAAH